MKNRFITIVIISALLAGFIQASLPGGALAQIYYVSSYNAPPQWQEIPYLTVEQGDSLSLTVSAIDDNGDPLTYSVVSLPENALFDPLNRLFRFQPNYNQLGSFPVTLSVTDNKSPAVLKTFYVGAKWSGNRFTYGGADSEFYPNQAPYFTSTASYYQIRSGNTLRFQVLANDPEGSLVSFSVSGLPAGATLSTVTGEFVWAPVRSQRGVYDISFFATDGEVTSPAFHVTIVVDSGSIVMTPAVPTPAPISGGAGQPYFTSSPSLTVAAGQTYIYDAQAFDPNNDLITYQLIAAPAGSFINSATGVLAWVAPTQAGSAASYQFTVAATDGRTESVIQTFTLAVSGIPPAGYVYASTPARPTAVTYQTAPTDVTRVVTARTIAPTYSTDYSYGPPTGSTGSPQAGATAFNVAIRVNEDQQTIVSWDTPKPARGEVVFGSAPQPSARILNYEFTTGQSRNIATRHEANLGQLELNKTYYLRTVSRTGASTDIADEIAFIPFPYTQQVVVGDADYQSATAVYTFGDLLGSGWFLLFLLIVILALAIYLLATRRSSASTPSYPPLEYEP